MAVQNINNLRRGRQQSVVIKSGTQQRVGATLPNLNQLGQQARQNIDRNLQTANPVNLGGAFLYTSQYGDEALADAKRRAAQGDVVSQLYVNANEALLKPVQETFQRDYKKDNVLLNVAAGAVGFLPSVISTIPAGLQAINLLQRGDSSIVRKGYEGVPGIITDTVSLAKESPAAFAGAVLPGAVLGGSGLRGVSSAGKAAKAGNTIKGKSVADIANVGDEKWARRGFRDTITSPPRLTTLDSQKKSPEVSATIKQTPIRVRTGGGGRTKTASPQNTLFRQSVGSNAKGAAAGRIVQNTPAKTTSTQRTVIRGNVPSEFRGNLGNGYSADVKIRGNTFVLTPVDTGITLNTPSPTTIRPVSFDDVVQNLVRGQGIAIKTGDRKSTLTRMQGGATLEPGGVRARFPDYSPNIYRAVSSDDYFASAIGGRSQGVDIYTYPFGVKTDFSPNQTPKNIKPINPSALFKLMDKTMNPAPMRPQDLSAFKDRPQVREIELVEVGQTTKPRELPANISPLRISKITEYVTEYQKISFISQKSKSTGKVAAAAVEKPATGQAGRVLTFARPDARSGNADIASPFSASVPTSKTGLVATSTVAVPNAKLSAMPATIPPVIPGDVDLSGTTAGISDSSSVVTSGDTSTSIPKSSDTSMTIPRVRDADASAAVRMRQRAGGKSSRVRRRAVVRDDSDNEIRRIRGRGVDTVKPKRTRKRKDANPEEEEEKKKKKQRRTKTRTYRQKVNPLPWLEDPTDTSWTRKDLTFMRMPANVKVTAVRSLLEAYNEKVKAYNAARKKLRSTAGKTTAEGRKSMATLKSLYKAANEARQQALDGIEKNRR